jgi:hypothetical protein
MEHFRVALAEKLPFANATFELTKWSALRAPAGSFWRPSPTMSRAPRDS